MEHLNFSTAPYPQWDDSRRSMPGMHSIVYRQRYIFSSLASYMELARARKS